jgi:hypothetical protein
MSRLTRRQARGRLRNASPTPLKRELTEEEEMEQNMAEDNMGALVEMHAFDQLPPAIREALRATPYGASARLFLARLQQGHSEAQLLEFLEKYATTSRREAVARGVPAEFTSWPALPGAGKAAPRDIG